MTARANIFLEKEKIAVGLLINHHTCPLSSCENYSFTVVL
jgi:hypothetical protein